MCNDVYEYEEIEVYTKIKDNSLSFIDFQIWVEYQKDKVFDEGSDYAKYNSV